jgi:hypothetical protein
MSTSHRVAFRYRLAREDREALADLEHDRWSRWMKYQFSKGTFNDDGSWTMPAESVERWKRQMETPYADLTESEKDSDRREADKTLKVLGAG